MKTKLTIISIERKTEKISFHRSIIFNSMTEAIYEINSLDKQFTKQFHRFTYVLAEVEDQDNELEM